MAKATPAKPASLPPQSKGVPFVSVAILIGIVALAADALHVQLGRIKYTEEVLMPYLDRSDTHLRRNYTGFAPIDGFLVLLIPMFESMFTGEMPELSLNVFYFAGQLVSILVLLISIGNREGKSWNVTRFFAVWGIIIQSVGLGVVFPFYLAIDLLFSSTQPQDLFLRDPSQFDAIVPAIALGYGVPSVLPLLPISADLRQIFIAAWQPFPIYVAVVLSSFSDMFKKMNPVTGKAVEKREVNKRAVGHAYRFAMLIGAFVHWTTLAVIAAAAVKPDLFPQGVAQHLTFQNVFIPHPVHWYGPATIASATMQFFQYDQYMASAGAFVWAATVANRAGVWSGSVGDWTELAKNIVAMGPASAALALVWKRDDAVFSAR